MAQDVFSEMAEEPWTLNEDGYLKVDTDVKEIIYHPSLNVILICTHSGIVRVLDVNSGVILQSTNLSAQNNNAVKCKYIPTEDRVLFCDGQAIGVRTDYNGVLLLDSILQKDCKQNVKIEVLLSEAVILKQSIVQSTSACAEQVVKELEMLIANAQYCHKKGIKAQKWNTVCIDVSCEVLRLAISSVVSEYITKNIHTPELQVASAVKERISQLLGEQTNASDKKMMASEARRRETFSQWPHMDYKWALPEQMAQAGFYHQPNSAGDDRAMCFTCSVCLVSWERTDEPWSEHERHSPTCPFVIGEYTQNVPMSVTNATGPAIDATFRGENIDILGASSIPKLLPTCTKDGLISVFDVSGKIKRTHSFFVTQFDSHILEKLTQHFGMPGFWNEEQKSSITKKITSLAIVSDKTGREKYGKNIRPTVVCGITISQIHQSQNVQVNPESETLPTSNNILEYQNGLKVDRRCLYLVVYDFMYIKGQEDAKMKIQDLKALQMHFNEEVARKNLYLHSTQLLEEAVNNPDNTEFWTNITSFYKTLIPGESNVVFLPPGPAIDMDVKKSHSGPRLLSVEAANTVPDNIDLFDNIITDSLLPETNESSISDHIADLKNNQSTSKKLNYSRTVQCISLPEEWNDYDDLEIISILPTHNDSHILVTVCSASSGKSFLLTYALDFTNKMVKINEASVKIKELLACEKPVEVSLLPVVEKFKSPTSKSGSGEDSNAILVCEDGAVRIVNLSTLCTVCLAKIETGKFVSAAYCHSLERLCASTTEGSLHFFALNDSDNESVDDHEEDDLFGFNIESSIKELSSLDRLEMIECFKEPPKAISVEELKILQKITFFNPIKFLYNVAVPPCWSEFQQAMRQRRNSPIVNNEAFTKTWRLQTDTTTWEEHMFEITLPAAMVLGHVDVHFTLQSGCVKPSVEVSLLRQTKSGIVHSKDVKFAVDDTVTIDMLRRVENPVISEEYLRAHNADILAGPVNICHHLDLTEQSGTVTLTSPRLFKVKARNLLLHVRAVYDKVYDKDDKRLKESGSVILDKMGMPVRKNEQYLGCDCIHEISIAIYTPTNNAQITHERTLRNLMLESNVFIQSLIDTIRDTTNAEVINHALEVLNWVAGIRLVPNKTVNADASNEQLEFIYINGIEENMDVLLRKCFLQGDRSISYKCMTYLITCSRGAKLIGKSISEHFNNAILEPLLKVMDDVKEIKSPGGLHWLLALLLKINMKDNEELIANKCVALLNSISHDLIKRSNPYHLLLRSRYGLYGLPMEPELFDFDPPTFAKGSSAFTFNSLKCTHSVDSLNTPVAEAVAVDTPIAGDKLKYKNASYPKLVKGLIETVPLHYTCINSSDGTKLETSDASQSTTQTAINNILPFVVSPAQNSISKIEDFDKFVDKYIEADQLIASHLDLFKHGVSTVHDTKDPFEKKTEAVLQNILDYEDWKMDMSTKLTNHAEPIQMACSSDSDPSTSGSGASDALATSVNNLNPNSFPWQQLLVAPPKQVIVVERMHSGARRHVILDFGDCVSLTDILIPSCSDLVSLIIDVWLFGENIDAVRIVTTSDISSKNLVLSDLQPPALCRFMKITVVGRYGMSTTRCRIPLGYFYGHVVVLPREIPPEVYVKPVDYEKHLNSLSKLLEDISCRYSLSCSKLKDYLEPFLVADMKNTLHLFTYINILKDRNINVTNPEHKKIFTAYQETLTYQHQLNVIRNVIVQIESSLPESKNTIPFPSVSTDKLNAIAEGLLEVLLSTSSGATIDRDTCEQLFRGLCMFQSSRLQILAAIFLEKACGNESFWGNFLSDTLTNVFATSCTEIFPQDRLFVLLIYFSRKSGQKSAVIDAALRAVYYTLKPLELNASGSLLLAVQVDLPLVSWLLMYLSLQLTFEKNDRWDWVFGEMVGKVNADNAKKKGRKKTVKRVAPTFGTSGQNFYTPMVCTLNEMQNVLPWKKFGGSALKDCAKLKSKLFKKFTGTDNDKPVDDSKDPTCLKDLMAVPQSMPQFLDAAHCLAVARVLLKFIISMDHSGSADMMLLAFKIISKLVAMAELKLCQLLSEPQLLELINFSLACKVPWAPFALSCFLQDALELQSINQQEVVEMDTDVPTSSSSSSSTWPTTQNENGTSETDSVNNYDIPLNTMALSMMDWDQSKSKIKALKLAYNQLPLVYEIDSNESEIDDVIESLKCPTVFNIKSNKSSMSTTSNALDARLEIGVCAASNIALRKLTSTNTQKLLQNISQDKLQMDEDMPQPWPEQVATTTTTECNTGNLKMLSYCFDELFKNLHNMQPSKIENVLHLWLTLNSARKDEKFDSSATPSVSIKIESVDALIHALAWTPGLSLTTWCLGLQALTLVCNTTTNNGKKWFDLSGMANAIVGHRDFVQMFISLLSGSGVVFTEKSAAGPTLCKALHDFLVRLQVRCDIVSQSSKLGNLFKTLLLNVVYQLARTGGPIANRMGPLDAQCKLLQSILYLDFTNIDISIGMSTLESTAVILNTYFLNIDNIKCVTLGEKSASLSYSFGDIFANVLGTDSNKQDRPVSYEDLLINLLKLLGKLVQTPITCPTDDLPMETEQSVSSQTDESKAEQIQSDSTFIVPPSSTPFFADTILQHHPTVVTLCKCLAACKSSSLCMLTNLSQKYFANFTEPNTVGDAVFHILSLLTRKASRKELLMEPLRQFLSQSPQLSEPFVWFVLQVLENEEAIREFYVAGGISILASSIVNCSNTPSTISRNGTISTVMQHFNGYSNQETQISAGQSNKLYQAMDNSALINFAPSCTITCQSVTSQPADVLIQTISGATHRRARAPLWSYNYYQDEMHTELLLQLPNAVLLKEVQLQPHAGGLATCPSFVAIETSASGPSRLVPACHPLPTSGLTFIRMHLPTAKVVNCVLIRLYKPRVGNSIGLSQIRLLGTYAFGRNSSTNSLDNEDDSYCNHSLGWLRILHHCFNISIDRELKRQLVNVASLVPNLLSTCCGLLLFPSHILPVYLPCLEKVLRELALLTPENGVTTIKILLDNRISIVEPMMSLDNAWQDRLMVNVSGYQSACELLYQICDHQDANTAYRVKLILEWLGQTVEECLQTGNSSKCSPAYVSTIASILWYSKQNQVPYDLQSLTTLQFFEKVYDLKMQISHNNSLKYALDSLLCSLCYIRPDFFPLLLQKIGILVPNLSSRWTSDDRKDTEGMTDDRKQDYVNSERYGNLKIGELSELNLTKEQLETVALASRSPNAIQQLLDSGLPKLLNKAIYEFCGSNDRSNVPMAKLEKVTTILQFFTDVCDEKMLRDWLGSSDGSSFWPHLLHWLCKKPFSGGANIQSEAHAQLEEVCVKFLAKCCLCHAANQARLATVLCEVIGLQQNGISGFLRRMILQLLLENEKVPVSIEADETLFKTAARMSQVYVPAHPAFKQTYNRTMLHLSTTTTLGDILEQHLFISTVYKSEYALNKKSTAPKIDAIFKDFFVTEFSDLSMAAGVTAKDKRAKDIKNMATFATPLSKKKRLTSELEAIANAIEGRLIKCLAYSDEALPLNLNLGQLLQLMVKQNATNDWPYIHLTVCQSKCSEDRVQNKEAVQLVLQLQPISSALQVFSAMGGLSLLAQNLPTIYPDAIRVTTNEKVASDPTDSEWIKLEDGDDIYEDFEDTIGSPSKSNNTISHIPPHSLTAFSLFLRLPGYAEVLLKDTKKALCMLRLMLGVTDDGEGGDIFQSPVASSLPTLPFEALQRLYDTSPLCSDDGRLLRRISVSTGVVHLLLALLSILTHHSNNNGDKDAQKDAKSKEERQLYWAKGTGFGTGSTQQSWNVEQALMKQKNEEEHVTVLLEVLSSYINPNDSTDEELGGNVLPAQFPEFLQKSSLLPALSSYLRNDSVLDMARHIPLYKAVLKMLRALAASSQLINLLLPQKSKSNEPSMCSLLKNMKSCVDTYANKLRVQKAKTDKTTKPFKSVLGGKIDDFDQGEGLATLMPDIQNTANIVAKVTDGMIDEIDTERDSLFDKRVIVSPEERYIKIMKNLQFASYEMIEENSDGMIKFVISHHFEAMAKATTDQSHPSRVKRIAQETATLSTSLPLSYSSSVFVRYDTSRFDVMKVLITGPADTPYANGCFELDVFFPADYPLSPMLINLETTGHHTVRFNPNLYNDGKVCLSVLNTWHGRPEEKWNAQTSSFLQVLVSIQSLILVPEPYFNEPGYERARGTPAGTSNSKDYNLNICQATVQWAMLNQIVNPCPCFKDVIHAHFYMKKQEILHQVEKWIEELELETKKEKKNARTTKKNRSSSLECFKLTYKQLKDELMKLKPPQGDEIELDQEEESPTTPTNSMEVSLEQVDTDKEMEKLVNDICK